MHRVFIFPKLDDPKLEDRLLWLSEFAAVVEDDKVNIISNRFSEEHGESNWDELVEVMKKTTDSHKLDDVREFLDGFEKTNVQDHGDREENQTTKPDADEVSGSSDCSAVFGPGIKYVLGPEIRLKPGCDIKERDGYKYIRGEDADIVWGPTSKIYPVNNWNEPARVTFVDGVWTVID